MTSLPRRIAFASFAAVLALSTSARAFTDSNAEVKEATADRYARVVVIGKAAPPTRTAWVPPSAKSLDGFKPVLPPERALGLAMAQAHAQSQSQARAQMLARAEIPAAVAASVKR